MDKLKPCPKQGDDQKNAKIIAVDFDGCLATNNWPDIGDPISETIEALKQEQEAGARVILWTCRCREQLSGAVDWCLNHGIELAAVNSNLPEIVEAFGGDTVKVFANEYWDDRARKMPPDQKAQPWIPVTERLPRPGERVLMCLDGVGAFEGWLDDGRVWVRHGLPVNKAFHPQTMVTHWMPMPEAPEVDQNG